MLWVERLTLSNFRNYTHVALEAGPEPQVLIGANGAGKTNLLEAVSLLSPGQGMRRAAYSDLACGTGDGGWAVAAHTHTHVGPVDIGTGLLAENAENERAGRVAAERAGRIVRINGETAGAGALADYVELVWVTPAMDGLFTGAGSERRRFLDRLILCFDPGYRSVASRFERAMQQRNRLLADNVRDPSRFEGLELLMAETGVAIAVSACLDHG
jgi:DNA replication and repair protein RecF